MSLIGFGKSKTDPLEDSDSHEIKEEEPRSLFDELRELLKELEYTTKSSHRPLENPKPQLPTRQVRGYKMDDDGRISLNPIPLKKVASRYSLDDPLMQSAHNNRQIPDAYTVRNF